MNLAVNARDAMPKGGRLTIRTAGTRLDERGLGTLVGLAPGPYVVLAVADTGVGMDAETKLRIFEPFFTTKVKGKGTGLGLSTVYGIVEQSAGGIRVESEPGEGSTFYVYLPEVEGAEPLARPGPAEPAAPGSATVLVVEDEEGVRSLARQVLDGGGYTVLTAADAEQAIETCQSYRGAIHLMVTDVVMPGLSGRELALRVASLRPDMRVLYMSGYTNDAIVRHGVLHSDLRLIQKPFTPNALLAEVARILATASQGLSGSATGGATV